MFPLHRTLTVHPHFERMLLATTVAGAVAWAILGGVQALGLRVGPTTFAATAIPAALTAGFAVRRPHGGRPLALGAAAGAGSSLVLLLWFGRYPAFALLAAGALVGAAASRVPGWLARLNGALALGLATFAGVYASAAVGSTGVVHVVPPILAHGLLGAAFGFIAGFGPLATHAHWKRDTVELFFQAQRKRGTPPPLAVQAVHLYRRIRETLPRGTDRAAWRDTERTVSRLVLQVLGLADQAREMAEHIALSDVDALTRRQTAMRDAAAGASDAGAKRHYADTAAVLAQRLERLQQFGHRRERVEALCHHGLSVLENLRLALAQARLTGQNAGLEEVDRALHRLHALQSELDCTAEALRELESDAASVRSPPPGSVAPEPAT